MSLMECRLLVINMTGVFRNVRPCNSNNSDFGEHSPRFEKRYWFRFAVFQWSGQSSHEATILTKDACQHRKHALLCLHAWYFKLLVGKRFQIQPQPKLFSKVRGCLPTGAIAKG